ncbi:E3 ubiquitin-protein ligase ATL23-like [Musa troglodytarum]|uniref:E3 ubiquitin-protein ligase ATL23-like n=2 Tax=Musa troglodytarum TaxID=320322 RepID=A0A9E7K2B9_9LILI|nr:E3 ubiquitin-protein ligase ATL23-like [Musa troglodytarum]
MLRDGRGVHGVHVHAVVVDAAERGRGQEREGAVHGGAGAAGRGGGRGGGGRPGMRGVPGGHRGGAGGAGAARMPARLPPPLRRPVALGAPGLPPLPRPPAPSSSPSASRGSAFGPRAGGRGCMRALQLCSRLLLR